MVISRLWRTFSAFNPSTRRWAPVFPTSRNCLVPSQVTQKLTLTSWNIDAFSPRAASRAKLIIKRILEDPKSPDIVFLQEVTRDVRASLLDDARVRAAFLVTDAEDRTAFENVPFATITMLSRAHFAFGFGAQENGDTAEGEKVVLRGVFRSALPSKYGRDALCVDIIPPASPGTAVRLINVHLDSLAHTLHYRAQQLEILADLLHAPDCSGGLIAGDFNAILPEDGGLVEKTGLVDAWVALHRRAGPDGSTWGVGAERRDRLGPNRLDKVAMMGLKAQGMEVLRPGFIEVPRPGETPSKIPWSDHCGLLCTFVI